MAQSKNSFLSALASSVTSSGTVPSAALAPEVTASIDLAGNTVYDSAGLLPLTGLTAGQQAWAGNKIFISNGSGWFNVATINLTPQITSGVTGSPFTLDSSSGTATTISLVASDSDGTPVLWSYSTSDSAYDLATITNDSNGTFTVAGKSLADILAAGYDSTGGSFNVTFKASDGIAFDTDSAAFSLTYYVSVGPPYEWDSASSEDTILNTGSRSDLMGYNNMGSTDEGNFLAYSENDIAYMHYHNGTSWSSATSVSGGTNFAFWGMRIGGSEAGSYFVVTTGDTSGNLYWWKVAPSSYTTDFTNGNKNTISSAAGAASYLEAHDCWTDGDQKIFLIAGGPRANSSDSRDGEVEIHYSTNAGSSFSSIVLSSPNPENTGFFGYSVAINDNICVVGAPYENVHASTLDLGRLYIYKTTNNWASASLIATFDGQTHGDNIQYHSFGIRCDISNNKRVITCGYGAISAGIKVFDPNDADNPTSYSQSTTALSNLNLVEPMQIASHGKQIICTRYDGSSDGDNHVYVLRDDDGTWSIDAVLEQSDQTFIGDPYTQFNCSATINGSFAALGDFCAATYPNGRIYVWNGTAV